MVGFHAVILAASSPLLRSVLEDPTRGGEAVELLMPDYRVEEVENLLDILYTGTAENNITPRNLMKLFLI